MLNTQIPMAKKDRIVPTNGLGEAEITCKIHHRPLVCPACMGGKGLRARKRVSQQQRREWGKMGGRPRKAKN